MDGQEITTETRFAGLPISGGIALAKVCLFNDRRHSDPSIYKVTGLGGEREKTRLRQAVAVATQRLETLATEVSDRLGPAEAQIFKAQKAILNDRALMAQMLEGINTHNLGAESTISLTLNAYEARLLALDNQYIKERASDIGEIRRRLLDALADTAPALRCGNHPHCQRGRNRIIVAEELTPSLTVELDTKLTMGFVTEHGGLTSHAAILARSLGIPAVSGIKNVHNLLSCGTELLVNGDTGEVVVWPSEETKARFRSAGSPAIRTADIPEPVPGLSVMANISRSAEVADALHNKAEGIGLYRTEFEFLMANRILNEEDQLERYASVVQAMEGRPVYFRLLDVGGDKGASFFDLPREDNPYLGFRGSRLLLARNDLLKAQARALARASIHGPVHVMYPMIVELAQFLRLKQLFCEAIAGLATGEIRHGVMFEVPSACLQARELLEAADFASIGSNDLIQYLFAVDRNNERVAYDHTPDRPVFWSLVAQLAQAAARARRPLSVCGELAGSTQFLPKLIEQGIDTVSVPPRLIPQLRLAAFSSQVRSSLKIPASESKY